MARIYIEKLSKIVVDNIKSGAYSNKELDRIYEEVKKAAEMEAKGFLRATILALSVGITLPILAILAAAKSPMADTTATFVSSALTLGIIVLLLALIKLLVVDRMMNQFLHALKIGYPEKTEQYSRASFRFNNIG